MRSISFIAPLVALALAVLLTACGSAAPPAKAPASPSAPQASSIASAQAAAHTGERRTVCGPVVDSRYATGSKGKPTFLNFDRAYPNHTFVVVIWDSDRGNFPNRPESYYKGKEVCATGLIESYQGKPEIIAKSGSQLVLAR